MSFTPPTTFADGTTLTSAALEANQEALRVYLHRGVVASDFSSTQWVDTRHVQPPDVQPYTGLQHGVTGWQGGQWAGGEGLRLTFSTKYLSGNGRTSTAMAHALPAAAFSIDVRRAAKALYHYWWEIENGPDESTAGYQVTAIDRTAIIVPFYGNIDNALSAYGYRGQETRNMQYGMTATYPGGVLRPFVQGGGYGAKQGTFAIDLSVGTATFGLAVRSLADRGGIVNWGANLEVYYL